MKNSLENKYTRLLRNATLQNMGRCANMAWLDFQAKDGTHLALHIQSTFGIGNEDKWLLTSDDFYHPASHISLEDFTNWDVQGSNLYDEKVSKLNFDSAWCIADIQIASDSSLRLTFENGYQLQAVCSCSRKSEVHRISDEEWRLFEAGNVDEEHMVAYPYRIEME